MMSMVAAADQVEHNMLAFGKAVVAFANICALFSPQRVFDKPLITGFNALQIAISQGFAPGSPTYRQQVEHKPRKILPQPVNWRE